PEEGRGLVRAIEPHKRQSLTEPRDEAQFLPTAPWRHLPEALESHDRLRPALLLLEGSAEEKPPLPIRHLGQPLLTFQVAPDPGPPSPSRLHARGEQQRLRAGVVAALHVAAHHPRRPPRLTAG